MGRRFQPGRPLQEPARHLALVLPPGLLPQPEGWFFRLREEPKDRMRR